jgi:hypothetical protein
MFTVSKNKDGDSLSAHQLMSLEIKHCTTHDGILYSGHRRHYAK